MTTHTILTIDDDQDINNLLQIYFKDTDYNLITCTKIEDFFSKVLSIKPSLCLVDLNLDDHNGFGYKIVEMMRKKMGHDIIIIVMSRRNSAEDISHALECGANDYIQKPVDKKILMTKLSIFLNTESNDVTFPYYNVPTTENECTFEMSLSIHSISEDEIKLFSDAYIAKGSHIVLRGGLLNDMAFIIKNTFLDRELQGYILTINLDREEHSSIMPQIRRILVQNIPYE